MNNEITKGLNFGFLGLGQCGGNIVNEIASYKKYKIGVINTSKTDLDLLNNISNSNKLLIINNGIQGAGKNPEIGEDILKAKIDDVYKFIQEIFSDIKNDFNNVKKIFIVVGLGGGTGSGMVCLLSQMLIEEGYEVSIIASFPSDIESPKSQLIALNVYSELSSLEGLGPVFIIDNQKEIYGVNSQKLGLKSKYNVLNKKMIRYLDNINCLSSKPSLIAFDARDLNTTLEQPGLAIINEIEINNIEEIKEKRGLTEYFNKLINTSIFLDVQNQESKVSPMAAVFLFELPKGKGSYINEEAMMVMQENVDNSFDIFYGIYESDKKQNNTGKITILLTGFNFNNISRISEIEKNIEKKEKALEERFSQNISMQNSKKDLLNKFSRKKQNISTDSSEKKKTSILSQLRNNK